MARLAISLFGGFQVMHDGAPPAHFQLNKVQALLAYLVLKSEQPQQRSSLAGLLWPDKPERAALANLRQALKLLRQALNDHAVRPALLISRHTVQLNPTSDVWVDTILFTQLMAASQTHDHAGIQSCPACIRRLEEALELYKDNLLEGVLFKGSAELNELFTVYREWYASQVINALKHLIAYYEEQGQYTQVMAHAQRWLKLDPWSDSASYHLIQALALIGQRTTALEQYDQYCRALQTELGLEPTEEIKQLVEQIRGSRDALSPRVAIDRTALAQPDARSSPAGPAAQSAIPLAASTTSFVDRKQELPAIKQLLQQPTIRLVTLTGAGGSGKTRLALQAASELREHFSQGVVFISLAATNDPALVAPVIAQAVGIQEQESQSLLASLKLYLQDRQMLLLIDNFEHLLAAAELIAELLAAAPKLKVLATSRVRLQVYGEHELVVPPLLVPASGHLLPPEVLAQVPSVALFIDRVSAVRPEFRLAPENQEAVAEICARLDGLPLAIELAAAQSKLHTPQTLLALLRQPLASLTSGTRDLPERQRALRHTIDWSYGLLTAEEQRLFARLAVFADGASQEVVEQVCGVEETQRSTAGLLSSLVDKSMVQYSNDSAGEQRFFLLKTLQDYAQERLAAAGEEALLRRRHACHYLQLAESLEFPFLSMPSIVQLKALEREHNNIRAALTWMLESGNPRLGLRLANAIWMFWYVRGYWSEGYRWIEQLLSADTDIPVQLRAQIGYRAAFIAWSLGRYEEVIAHAEAGLASSREAGDTVAATLSLSILSLGVLYQGEFAQAKALGLEALALSRELGLRACTVNVLLALGHVAWYASDAGWSMSIHEESLALGRELNDSLLIGLSLSGAERATLQQGHFELATRLCQESWQLFTQLGDRRGMAKSLLHLGNVAYYQGKYRQAAEFYEHSMALYHELGDKRGISTVLSEQGLVALQKQEYALACRLQQDSLALARELGDQRRIVIALASLGLVVYQQGRIALADSLYSECLRILHPIPDLAQIAIMLEHVALRAVGTADARPAAQLFGAAEKLRALSSSPFKAADRVLYAPAISAIKEQLAVQDIYSCWQAGWSLDSQQAIDYALAYLHGQPKLQSEHA